MHYVDVGVCVIYIIVQHSNKSIIKYVNIKVNVSYSRHSVLTDNSLYVL